MEIECYYLLSKFRSDSFCLITSYLEKVNFMMYRCVNDLKINDVYGSKLQSHVHVREGIKKVLGITQK